MEFACARVNGISRVYSSFLSVSSLNHSSPLLDLHAALEFSVCGIRPLAGLLVMPLSVCVCVSGSLGELARRTSFSIQFAPDLLSFSTEKSPFPLLFFLQFSCFISQLLLFFWLSTGDGHFHHHRHPGLFLVSR